MVSQPDNEELLPPEGEPAAAAPDADADAGDDEPIEAVRGRGVLVNGLSSSQEAAIIALLNEPTIPKAAEAAQVGHRTLCRWLTEPVFAKAYRAARRDAFGHAITQTQRYAPLAVATLAKIMTDPKAPHHAKVSAATAILKFGREGIELDDLAARVEALEQAADTNSGAGPGPRRWAS